MTLYTYKDKTMCIYLTDRVDLHYDSKEHIFPAGIDGIKTLPHTVVSREFNRESSRYEDTFIHQSLIALPRQLHGPGKRGSLDPAKATKSSIQVLRSRTNEEIYSLGYIKLGKPHENPQVCIKIENGNVVFSCDKSEESTGMKQLCDQLLKNGTLSKKAINDLT
ncbi:hypothetical protein J2T02_002636 [Chitinophaga terrae (ex Kim and Jung 2007)]|uniref:hypothetical protein n=1 Tax=Chitinophaga terrae (ex Kim and Jung 2007) TaxID=408074 RepID=UPI00277D4590|nr:hypothetical protein [Chitinophaga terrae (ex Kim and Jung 2007)]MDQ0107517.1 hypothetical protein [Chitinophaga terrae (ex Kim and Jung 2007)]